MKSPHDGRPRGVLKAIAHRPTDGEPMREVREMRQSKDQSSKFEVRSLKGKDVADSTFFRTSIFELPPFPSLMDQQHAGLRQALVPDCRGGVYGQVLAGGAVCIGDHVTLIA
ncbi:MAG: hypothetical protein V1790_19250 [Planctomycetota bacterium]